MKLISLWAKNVYKQFNFDIKFFPDVSILFGINGSGKTTVLKLINYVITGRFPDLLGIDFDELILKYSYENKEYYLKITKELKEKKSNIVKKKEEYEYDDFEEIDEWSNESIGEELIFETNHLKLQNVLPREFIYRQIHNFEKLIELKQIRKQLSEIFNVIFLSIERKPALGTPSSFLERLMYDDEFFEYLENKYGKKLENITIDIDEIREDYHRFNYRRRRSTRINSRFKPNPREIIQTPLRDVIRMIIKAHREYFRYCSKLDSYYQQDSYEKLVNFDNFNDITKKLEQFNLDYIKIAKDRIINQIKFFANEFNIHFKYEEADFQNLIDNFEAEREKAINQKSLNNDYLLNFIQFIKLDESAKLLEENNKKKSEKYKPFKLLLDNLGEFFSVTDKSAFLDEKGFIKFQLENDEIIHSNNLSSGEQQILIFFTYLIFKGREIVEPIMLYDEPELSLHLDWQEKFIESILKINESIQIILATHSPAIGKKFPKNYIELKSINEISE